MIGIYKITNKTTNKIYIGQSINILQRWYFHIHEIERGRGLVKYESESSIKDFTFEIIELCPQKDLDARERYWIQYYNSYEDGLNRTEGGKDGNFKLQENTLRAIKNQEKKAEREQAIYDTLKKWINVPLDDEKKKEFTQDLIKAGLRDKNGKKNFTFQYILKYIEKIGRGNYELIRTKANKKIIKKYPYIKYQQNYRVLKTKLS